MCTMNLTDISCHKICDKEDMKYVKYFMHIVQIFIPAIAPKKGMGVQITC
jgi:hypothetical protein